MESGIYLIKNKINSHSYVGMSKNIKRRWQHHYNESTNINSKEYNKTLYRAFRKYGINNFDFIVLEYCPEYQLREKELEWINKLDTIKNGYNEYNGWQPEISAKEENHPNHKLTKSDVIDIRTRYNNHERCKEVEKLYENKIGHSGFSKVWKGETWKDIMPEVYTEENKQFHLHNTGNSGENNGRSKFTTKDIIAIRTRKKNSESFEDVYLDYSEFCTKSYFQEIWYSYSWKEIIV